MKQRYATILVCPAIAAALVFLLPEAAHAYGGPGSIISGIGALLAAVAAIGAALFGFVWFPAKKLYRRIRRREDAAKSGPAGEAVGD